MPDENTTTDDQNKGTSDGDGKNTDSGKSGADTQAAQSGADEKQYTKADVDAEVTRRISKEITKRVNAELKKRGIDPESGKPAEDIETIKLKAQTAEAKLRVYEAREQVEDYVSDKRNSVNVKNVRALFKYIKGDLEFNDEGDVTNLKDLITRAKAEAPELFQTAAGSADGGKGAQQGAQFDMNTQIRRQAGYAS